MFQVSLKAARMNAGLSSMEAAELAGVHQQTLLKYEKDSSNIPVSLFHQLATVYQIPEDYIFLGKEYELIRMIADKREHIA